MKHFLFISAILFLAACSQPATKEKTDATIEANADSAALNVVSPSADNDQQSGIPDEEYANYFIVIADTGLNYWSLRANMFALKDPLKMKIDTMDRYYNKKKDLIALPDKYDDEIYAGEYYPRRDPSEFLSLEYLNFFSPNTREKTIALVTGIYAQESKADSALTVLKKTDKKGFKISSKVYIGCMH